MKKNICNQLINNLRTGECTKEEMPAKVAILLDYFEIKNTPISIIDILTKFGIKTYNIPIDKPTISGYTLVSKDLIEQYGTSKIIFINENRSLKHQNFVLAHLLCNYIFEANGEEYYNKYDINDEFKKNDKKQRADMFAIHLLVPSKLIIEECFKIDSYEEILTNYTYVNKLANTFQVPEEIIIAKIKFLVQQKRKQKRKTFKIKK